MPPQLATRVTSPSTMANTDSNKSKSNACAAPQKVPSSTTTTTTSPPEEKLGAHGAKVKHKRRFCRIEGCEKIVKSQGLCQRHGAKPRLCKVEKCTKQAQGNFDGMCKSHFKEHKRKTTPIPAVENNLTPPEPTGPSVYDQILPTSVDFFPALQSVNLKGKMPLVAHLAEGFHGGKPPAWHRNEERRARGLLPIQNPATQLEGWERELVWMEILVLTGVPEVSFRHLARAWGRDKGFHMVLAQFICERHGDVQRKKRKREEDAGLQALEAASKRAHLVAAGRPMAVAVARQQQLVPVEQLTKKLGITAEEMKAVRAAMLTPERKKHIASLLRRRSSGASDGQDTPTDAAIENELSLIGADAWDDACYGDSNYNEALAADLFNLTAQESVLLQRRLSVGKQQNVVADDDSSAVSGLSRSVASGKYPPVLPGGPAAGKDAQRQHILQLPKRDSNISLLSNTSSQIPNTVAVKTAPGAEGMDTAVGLPLEAGQAGHSPRPQQETQQQQQQYNGHVGTENVSKTNQELHQDPHNYTPFQQQNTNLQRQESGSPQQQQQVQYADSANGQFDDGESQQQPKNEFCPPPNRGVQKQQTQSSQENASYQQFSAPTQQNSQQEESYASQTQQNYVAEAPQPASQQQHFQTGQFNEQTHAQTQSLHQRQTSQGSEHYQGQMQSQSLHQRQHSQQGEHLHGQMLSLHQRQHSQQGEPLHGQPFNLGQAAGQGQGLHQRQGSNQFHPLLGQATQSTLYGQQTGQGEQNAAQIRHQRQHSRAGLPVHGLPQNYGYQHQHPSPTLGSVQHQHPSPTLGSVQHQHPSPTLGSVQHQHPSPTLGSVQHPSSSSLHRRQHSQQGGVLHVQGQAQNYPQSPHPEHQTAQQGTNSPNSASGQHYVQYEQQHGNAGSEQSFQNPHSGHSFQNPHWQSLQVAPNHPFLDTQQSTGPPNGFSSAETVGRATGSGAKLHEYDHRNEHLQAEEDVHIDEDPSHDQHDYGAEAEIVHEDHNHEQQHSHQQNAPYVAKEIVHNSQASYSQGSVPYTTAPAPYYQTQSSSQQGQHPNQTTLQQQVSAPAGGHAWGQPTSSVTHSRSGWSEGHTDTTSPHLQPQVGGQAWEQPTSSVTNSNSGWNEGQNNTTSPHLQPQVGGQAWEQPTSNTAQSNSGWNEGQNNTTSPHLQPQVGGHAWEQPTSTIAHSNSGWSEGHTNTASVHLPPQVGGQAWEQPTSSVAQAWEQPKVVGQTWEQPTSTMAPSNSGWSEAQNSTTSEPSPIEQYLMEQQQQQEQKQQKHQSQTSHTSAPYTSTVTEPAGHAATYHHGATDNYSGHQQSSQHQQQVYPAFQQQPSSSEQPHLSSAQVLMSAFDNDHQTHTQVQAPAPSGFESQQGQQQQSGAPYHVPAQDDHIAAQTVMKDFAQEQPSGQSTYLHDQAQQEPASSHDPLQEYAGEALFELPYTQTAAANETQQQSGDGQQNVGTYDEARQAEGSSEAHTFNSSYGQENADAASSSVAFEQFPQAAQEQHSQGKSFQEQQQNHQSQPESTQAERQFAEDHVVPNPLSQDQNGSSAHEKSSE